MDPELGTMTARLAHELRNPLNAAQLQLDLARRRLARSGECKAALEALEVARVEVSRLARLIDEFLVLARPGGSPPARGDLRLIAASAVDRLRAEASARSVVFAVDAGDPVPAEIDQVRMSQALHTLLRDAIEATGDGGRLRVEVRAADGFATIQVEDCGPGLTRFALSVPTV